ncbi:MULTISPECIES: AMP-binding protein [Dickeya]|uniref:O-succinylbenzoic acid--CoA ligase n=1 Tax=Dickeya aquatica TaxID=1401087 RepID=A0A375AGB6_9GAMM|nr:MULTISPECIES: AMP-binding protein [Dickeya]SLM65148.1 O-succinylbenzoic acid--CoA ligase [Dickeya aquatica]
MNILNRIIEQASQTPDAPAIIQLHSLTPNGSGDEVHHSYFSLLQGIRALSHVIAAHDSHALPDNTGQAVNRERALSPVGLIMGNSVEWVVADLALLYANRVEVPVPLAFSVEQASWLLRDCDLILTDAIGQQQLERWQQRGLSLEATIIPVSFDSLSSLPSAPLAPPDAAQETIIKVIHTSGTTSHPKGVQIRRHGLDALVDALWQRASQGDYHRYLCLVPLSLLIEQVTAIYMPLTSGGAILLPPVTLPPLGSPGVQAVDRLSLIAAARPTAMTLTPALVEALAEKARNCTAENRLRSLFGHERLPLLAVGGAPVESEILHGLNQLGIPVYEGYGLSENSSVACWNYRGAHRIGTVGQPLPHVEIRLADDGELCLRSTSLFAGYAGDDPSSCHVDADGWLHTGDIARQDDEGFISIVGRKKTMIITANGRNISPEWLETAYRSVPGVVATIVFGDKRQFLGGIFIINDISNADTIRDAIHDYARQHLNELEQISDPILVPHHPDIMEQLFTVTGRPRRNMVADFLVNHEVTVG